MAQLLVHNIVHSSNIKPAVNSNLKPAEICVNCSRSLFPLGYHAPMDVYKAANSRETLSYTEQYTGISEINLCVGKEWHRFPSSFFLPNKK